MSQTVKLQRAYTTRRNDADNSLFVQQEAERLAVIDGDFEEAHRRRIAAQSLKAKHRRGEVKPIAFHLIRELGPRDAIANMLKTRHLEERHGRTALCLRDYMVCREVHLGGSGNLVFVEGGKSGDLADRINALRQGQRAVAAAEATLPSLDFVKPVTGLVCGHVTLLQAGRIIGGDTTKCKLRVKGALKQYLEAAEPFFH
jgi:hypothetical protein